MSDLLNDIREVVKKHEQPLTDFTCSVSAPPDVEKWIPICEEYKTSEYMRVLDEKGGAYVGGNKPVPVIAWVKVKIDPSKPMGITILEYCKLKATD